MTQAAGVGRFSVGLGLLLGIVAASACSSVDPCEGEGAACIAVQVEAAGDQKIDLLRSVYSVNGGPNRQMGHAGQDQASASLPILYALPLGEGGNVVIDVIAELGAVPVMRGNTSVSVSSGEHKRVTVTLTRDLGRLPFAGPEPRSGAGFVALPTSAPASLVMFGGMATLGEPYSETWEYNLAQKAWTRLVLPLSPSPRQPNMAADLVVDRAVVVQGMGPGNTAAAEAWQFASLPPGSPRGWSKLDLVTNPSPPRAFGGLAMSVAKSGESTAFFYGGLEISTGQHKGDLFRMLPTDTNLQPVVVNTPPVVRTPKLFAAVNGPHLVGCESAGTGAAKVWRFDGATNTWTVVSPDAGAPAFRTGFAAAQDPQTGAIVIVGGTSASSELLSDTYRFDLSNNTWSQIQSAAMLPPRVDASLTFAGGTYYLFGGRDTDQKPRTDNWKLTQDGWRRWL